MLIKEIDNNSDKYLYKYDKLNNITHIYHNDVLENKYYYDEYSQLVREDNYLTSKTTRYKYDVLGNIMYKKICELNTYNELDSVKFEYNNINWCDQVTKVNDISITYDEIGNPLTIGNNIVLNWINGRQLYNYNDSNNTINYKYNKDGLRISKTINNVETKYYLEGTSIILEKTGENVLYYLYNDTSDLIGLNYNGIIYYYIKNYQNDIIGLLDSNYNIIAKYEYDSFGNIINITDENNNDISNDLNHIANINPFRYRSYYYDKETKLYYLNNRYYNPLWGRFINADGIINGNKDVLGHNLYAYCSNDFVNKCDSSGNFFGMLALKATALFVGIKALITVASNIYLRNSKKDLSSDMFNKSMYDSKTPISKSIETKIIEKSKNSTPVINAVNTCIAKSNNTNFKDCEPESFEFTSADGDLHYSIQHTNIKISGLQQEDNWIITVKMSDTYDFTEFRTDDFFTVSTLANDLGYVMQKTGMLKPYDWDVQYSFIYENN